MSEKSIHEDEKNISEVEKEKIELPYLFEKELYNKANKKIHIQNEFIPTEKAIPIERKFYSKYDHKWIQDSQSNYMKYYKLTQLINRLPIEKYKIPLLESQCYGWMPKSLDKYHLELNRIYGPKIRCDLTIYDEKLRCEKSTERPNFNGEKFILD